MVSKITIWYFIVAMSLPIEGCVAIKETANMDAALLLKSAIAATDREERACIPSDFTTENEDVLQALRDDKFEIRAHDVEMDVGEVVHHFVLKERDSDMLISADVVAINGNCRFYTFSIISRDSEDK